MISPSVLLHRHFERRKTLRAFYRDLKLAFETQVQGLKTDNERLIATCGETFPDLKFQFFELESEHSTHFRIVGALGTIVLVLSEAEGFIGSLVHLHNDSELCDLSSFLVVEDSENGEIRMQVDRYGSRRIAGTAETVQLMLKELIFPTITPERIRATPEQRV